MKAILKVGSRRFLFDEPHIASACGVALAGAVQVSGYEDYKLDEYPTRISLEFLREEEVVWADEELANEPEDSSLVEDQTAP